MNSKCGRHRAAKHQTPTKVSNNPTYLHHDGFVIECETQVEEEIDGEIFAFDPRRHICTSICDTSIIKDSHPS